MALNAVDAVTPAWNRAIGLMFRPFRWAFWWRMAFVAFMTGEVSGGNGFNIPTDWKSDTSRGGHDFLAAANPLSGVSPVLIAAAAVIGLVVMVVFMYFACVFRFVLFDAVLTGRYRLREGFGRWQAHGTRFLWWTLAYFAAVVVCAGIIVALVLGGIAGMKGSLGAAGIAFVVIGVLVGIVVLLAVALIFVLTKDFVIPIMAFDGVSAFDAWSTLRRMITGDPMAYLGYIGMKIVLAMGAGMAMMMLTVVLLLFLGVPIGVVIALVVAGTFAASKALGIAVGVVLVGLGVLLLIFVMGLLGVPVATFFQAYAIQFFGQRFRPMELVMYPPPPQPAPVAPPLSPPIEPGPEPAPA